MANAAFRQQLLSNIKALFAELEHHLAVADVAIAEYVIEEGIGDDGVLEILEMRADLGVRVLHLKGLVTKLEEDFKRMDIEEAKHAPADAGDLDDDEEEEE